MKLLWFWRSRSRRKEELNEEIQAHLRMAAQDRIERGEDPEEARLKALREFGNVPLIEDVTRDTWSWTWLEELAQDLQFGLRILRKNAGVTTVILLILAIGIGANSAIFSAVNGVLLRPLPFAQPERLVFLAESCRDIPEMYFSMADLADWQAMSTAFESMGAARPGMLTLTGWGDPQHLIVRQVTASLFPTFGIKPSLGRFLDKQEDRIGGRHVVMLSESFWRRQFDRDPRVVGMQLGLNGVVYTVVGVVPDRGLRAIWHSDVDVYTSLGQLGDLIGGASRRDDHNGVYAYARLKPGVTLQQARSEMTHIAGLLAERFPKTNSGETAAVTPLLQEEVGHVGRALTLLMVAVGLVLLIACATVANLLTSLATVRRREIAIRSALGAGAARLARQFLCESILLALLGGAAGLLMAYCTTLAASAMLTHLSSTLVPRADEIAVDTTVLLFSFAVSLLVGIVFGVFPALAAYRTDPNEVLKDDGHSEGADLARMGLRSALAAAELALSLVLLVVLTKNFIRFDSIALNVRYR